jgi:hypothetical protein
MVLEVAGFNQTRYRRTIKLTFHGTKYVELAPDVVFGGPGLDVGSMWIRKNGKDRLTTSGLRW